MQVVFFSAATTVISEVTVSFCISMRKLTSVKIIKRRDTSNCSASTASSDKCQYVMVSWSVYDCVPAYTCERKSIQKHLYLFSIEPIKRYVTICGSIRLCISVCGCGYLSKENNEKTIRNVEQLTHAVMCGNMRWSFSFHLSVWMWIPIKRPQWRNNRNCCWIKPSSYVCEYVLLRFFVFESVDTDTDKLNAKKKQL